MEDTHSEEKIEVLNTISTNLKQARLLRGFTQDMLATSIGKSTNFISLIERQESGLSLSTLVDICNALQVDISIIFKGLITTNTSADKEQLLKSISLLENDDLNIVSNLVDYIYNSKS